MRSKIEDVRISYLNSFYCWWVHHVSAKLTELATTEADQGFSLNIRTHPITALTHKFTQLNSLYGPEDVDKVFVTLSFEVLQWFIDNFG